MPQRRHAGGRLTIVLLLVSAGLPRPATAAPADVRLGDCVQTTWTHRDGAGIDPQHLNAGRARHWGLTNMRERARQIGSELSLWSEVGAGTEVELRIPASVAYLPSRRLGSVRRLFTDFVRKDSTDER